jgi:catechol 2,3-dioxygenase
MYIIVDPEQSSVDGARTIASEERIGYVNLRVADLRRSSDFYCRVVGLRVVCDGPAIGIPTVFLAFGDSHYQVVLNWLYCDSAKSKHVFHNGLNNFSIVYPTEVLLAKAVARLLEFGGLIEDARDHGATLSVYLGDPDGHEIELYYDRPRSKWFESKGQLVIKSEPHNLARWLEGALACTDEVSNELEPSGSMEAA